MLNDDDKVPERLITALREADKARVFVPPEVDATILAKAKANLAHRRKHIVIPWFAAAAALIIAAFVIFTPGPKAREVDIRVALLLARKIAAGDLLGSAWDLNHDGRVDQNDAAIIAAQAVKLTKRGAS
jgi:hypothetical protein